MTATELAQAVHVGPRCILVLSGEIDIEAAPHVVSIARDALVGTGVTDVVIDASAVSFIDPPGVGALLDIRDIAVACGAAIRICGASDNVVKILKLMRLSTRFDLPT
jgi:anti-sigma B factor antagonist